MNSATILKKLSEFSNDELYTIAEFYNAENREKVSSYLDNTSFTDSEWEQLADVLATEIEYRQNKKVEDIDIADDTSTEKDYSKVENWFWFSYNLTELQNFDTLSSEAFKQKFDISSDDEYIAAKTSLKLSIQEYNSELEKVG